MTDFYKIIEYDEYGLAGSVSLVKAQLFKIKNGLVSIWTGDNEIQIPDFYVNTNDGLTIKRIGEAERRKMTDFYKIIEYDEYGLAESFSEVEARFLEIKNGFVNFWTDDNETQIPNIRINANDFLTIKRIKEEEKCLLK